MANYRAAGLSPAHAARLAEVPGRSSVAMIALACGCVFVLASAGLLTMTLSVGSSRDVAAVVAPASETRPAPEIERAPERAAEPVVAAEPVAAREPAEPTPLETAEPVEVVVLPAPEPVPTCFDRLVPILEQTRFQFAQGSADVDPRYVSTIEMIGQRVADCPEARVQIAGHSDSRGSDSINLTLSWDRAEAISAVMQAAGIDTSSFEVVGFGARMPLTEGSDTEDARNRRVELRLIGAQPEITP